MSSSQFKSLSESGWGTSTERLHAIFNVLLNGPTLSETIFNGVSNGISICDATQPEFPLIYVNPAFEAITGYSPGECYGRNCRFLQGSARDQPGILELRAATHERRNTSVLIRNYHKSGRLFWNQLLLSPILDSFGELALFIGIQTDVTAKVENDQARIHLEALVESSYDAIIGKDLNGIITSWNKGAENIYGYTASEIVGRSIRHLVPEDLQKDEDELLRSIRQGKSVEHVETKRVTKTGRTIDVSLTISPIYDSSGTVIGASKLAHDISERKLMEEQLHHSQKMEAIGQLTGGIAHDFNNMLAIVIGNLGLLERLIPDNMIAMKRVRSAQKGAARAADLTRRLLAFSSKEALEPKSTSVKHSIDNVVELADHVIGPTINIKTQFAPSLPLIFVDPTGLESALLNLVINARDAMPDGGVISIHSEVYNLQSNYAPVLADELKVGNYVCISVSDTGHGMSKEILDRVFEPFFTTKPRGKGTGLGLAMVYGFAKQSGGTVRIYSEIGYGTTVYFYFPMESRHEGGAGVAVIEESIPTLRRGSVLMVDDEEDLLEIGVTYLEEIGLVAYRALDSPTALKLLQQHPDITLVITDIVMPGGMNGIELARNIRRDHPDTSIIYTSGFRPEVLAERSMPLIDGPLLRKPYQAAELRALIETLIVVD